MPINNLRPAVFLDRDGTINVEKDYLINPEDFEFILGAREALKQLQDAGFLLVVVTNQSGIGRGYFSLEEVRKLHRHMQHLLVQAGVSLDGIYICPHHPTAGIGEYLRECNCRKGKPGLLMEAAEDLSISLSESYMVGDKEADLLAGRAAGCRSLLVKTGYGPSYLECARAMGVEIVADISTAAKLILAESQ